MSPFGVLRTHVRDGGCVRLRGKFASLLDNQRQSTRMAFEDIRNVSIRLCCLKGFLQSGTLLMYEIPDLCFAYGHD
jgi:hypothetical protein